MSGDSDLDRRVRELSDAYRQATGLPPEPSRRRPHGPLLTVAALVVGGLALYHFAGAGASRLVVLVIGGSLWAAMQIHGPRRRRRRRRRGYW